MRRKYKLLTVGGIIFILALLVSSFLSGGRGKNEIIATQTGSQIRISGHYDGDNGYVVLRGKWWEEIEKWPLDSEGSFNFNYELQDGDISKMVTLAECFFSWGITLKKVKL